MSEVEDAHKRKTITPKTRLRILNRDNFKCTNCGASPATDPRVYLEVDHYVPVSHGGADDDSNYRTLCRPCDRGKGNDEQLNKDLDADLRNLLDRVNPEVLLTMARDGHAVVVANSEEYSQIVTLNRYFDGYQIEPDRTTTLTGFGAGGAMGIYTLNDNGASKTRFVIAPRD